MAARAEMEFARQEQPARSWNAAARIAFRWCVVYFGLFCLSTQIISGLLPIPMFRIPDLAALGPVRAAVFWTAAHVFGVRTPLVYTGSGSGDKTFDWVLAFCILVVALGATMVWSVLDRRRAEYPGLHRWFRVFVRFALASQMMVYGIDKAVPLQMPFPYLNRLLEPYGNFSPMGVLWSSIGASRGYETFTGCAELLGGVLLVFPRTTTLGALVCLADTIEIFTLNMTYDVPVKLFSFHLVLMALVLLAPDAPRLLRFFLWNRATEPSAHVELLRGRRANRIALAVQIVFGILLLGVNAQNAANAWHAFGGGRAKSPLYGIWNIEQLAIDGQPRPPLVSDNDRWRRAIFDFPMAMSFERMDASLAGYNAAIDSTGRTLVLTRRGDANWKAEFTYQRPSDGQLILDGRMDGHATHMQLRLMDRNQFLLVNRGFHWIQEYPFNR